MNAPVKYLIRRVLFLLILPVLAVGGLYTKAPGLLEQLNPVTPFLHDVATGEQLLTPEDAFKDGSKIVVIMSWTDWCPVCHRMMPQLQRLNDLLQAKGYTEAEVIAMNSEDSDKKIKEVANKYGLSFTMLGGAPRQQSYPTIWIIVFAGGEWQSVDEIKGGTSATKLFQDVETLVLSYRAYLQESNDGP